MKILKYLSLSAVLLLVITACNSSQSLQEYLVEKRDSGEFISIDLPKSLFKFDSLELNNQQQQALASIEKVNVLALKYDETRKDFYQQEKATIQQILKSEQYNELARFKWDKINLVLTYEGNDEAVDEMILFGSDNSKGLVILRLLGKNMQPAQMTQLAMALDGVDEDSAAFGNLKSLFE